MPFLFHWWPEDEDMTAKREAFRDDWTVADLDAAYNLLNDRDDVTNIGILGHCWGGRAAWLGACNNPNLKACGVFYGGRIKLAFADNGIPPIELASQIQCPVLGIFGNEDQSPSPEDVNDYEAALQSANVPSEFHRYDDAGHGFQDSTNADHYAEQQSEDAWQKAIAFLDRYLK